MTINTQIMWTCLPNGFVTSPTTGAITTPLTLKMSVVVTPQFAAGGVIQGSVFEQWPAYVRAVTAAANGWTVAFNNTNPGNTVVGTMVDHISPSSSFNVDGGSLWQAIFPASTPIVSGSTSTTATGDFTIHSYDAGVIATAVRAAHRYAVESHVQHGKLVLTGSDPYSVLISERKLARRVLPKMATALRGVSKGAAHHVLRQAYESETGSVGLGYELMRHAMFYDHDKHRASLRAERLGTQVAPQASTNAALANDFNTILAHLGGQPQLLRKLGLIIDLTFPIPSGVLPGLPAAGAAAAPNPWLLYLSTPIPATYASALPNVASTLASVANVEPKTRADLTLSLFRPTVLGAPTSTTTGTINGGLLPLGDTTQYAIYTEDTEGSPIKLDIASQPSPQGADLATPFPALRTSGIAISQVGRDTSLNSAFARQTALANQYWGGASGNSAIYAEDVVRGYAVDVAVTSPSGTTTFQSVCQRDTRMFFPGLSAVSGVAASTATSYVVSDEGYTKASLANGPGGTELDLHSALFGWEGWSLAAQRPGRAITAATPAGDIVQTETPLQPVNTQASNYPNCQFTVRARAGSLPKLRYGNTYTFRARVLDLAGNDMSIPNALGGMTAAASVTSSASMPYLRYEPVPNPVVVLQQPLTEGEHVENLVIRSNPWGPGAMDAPTYASKAAANNPMNPNVYPNARWIAPPKGSWAQAEAMGAFDGAYLGPIGTKVHNDIQSGAITPGASYSNASFLPTKNALFQCSQKESGLFTDTQVWDTSVGAVAVNPATIVTPPTAQNLPPPTNPGQPMATGQYNILGAGAIIPYLPDFNAKGIALQEVGGTAVAATRTYAPRPGLAWPEIAMPQIQLQQAAIPSTWPPPAPSIANGVVVSGLGTPPGASDPIVFALAPGQQYSVQYGSLVADTTKMQNSDVDPTGTKAETIPTFAPYRTISMVHAVQQPKPPSALSVTVAPRQPGDTGITITGGFTVDGLTSQSVDFNASWVEFMDVEPGTNIIETTDGTHRRLSIKQGRVQSWTLQATDNAVSFTSFQGAATPPLYQQFGDTKTRMISFRATATSRFREFFPESLQASAANFQNSVPAAAFTEAQLLTAGTRIPSTARPIEPKILYVVPTFQWTSSTNATTKAVTNSRVGRGLRVFVDRPWYTTGDSEQLAVLVNPSGTAPTTIAAFVSQWGMDPIRNPQADSLGVLDQTQIVGGTLTGAVPLAELPGQSVSILAFNPSAYDPVRHLWYFDIEFAASAVEAPFVRLVLARYQTNSLGGPAFPNASSGDLRMSTVVQADMVKLSADRTGTYLVNADGSTTVTVAGHVYGNIPTFPGGATLNSNTVNPSLASGRMVYAQVMESTAATPGEFDWTPVGSAVLLQPTQLAGAPANSTTLSFMGSVPKPSGLAAGAKHQLLITEHEVFATDAETAFPGAQQVSNFPPGTMPMRTNAAQTTPTTSRILFSDILTLPY